jgi:hypothetical protein
MHTHVFNTYNHTGERPQGCQAREYAWSQLLKLVAFKVQNAVENQKAEIEQIEPEQIVSARDHDSLGDVFVRFRSCWHYNLTPHQSIIPLDSCLRIGHRCYNTTLTRKVLPPFPREIMLCRWYIFHHTQHIRHLTDGILENTSGANALMLRPDKSK